MQADKTLNLQKAILLLEELPESPRINQALGLLLQELDEADLSQEEILGAAKGQVEEIRHVRGQGSYVLQKVKCGDPTCHCSKKAGDYHGPYWYLFTKKGGKAKSKYIGKNLPAEAS